MKVRDVLKMLEQDGWRLDRTRGSHRQFKYSTNPGLVTVRGSLKATLEQAAQNSILKRAGLKK